MQLSDSPCSSSAAPNSEQNLFTVTIIDDRSLFIRLRIELQSLMTELEFALQKFRDDPNAFVHHLALKTFTGIRQRLTPTNVVGFTSACFVISSLALLVFTLDRAKQRPVGDPIAEDAVTDRPLLLVLTPTGTGRTVLYPNSAGRVGLSRGTGEGSSPTPAHAGGGGSGGMGELMPTQIGKIAQPSEIPAPIPKDPPHLAPSLPAAGVDIDPKLWTDINYPVFGDPQSRWNTRSNGPGENGGMGTRTGFGVGDGSGNGFGDGNKGNTGGGDRRIGYGGPGGNGGGGMGGPGGSNGGGGGGGISEEVFQKVRLLSKPEPHYTEEARRNNISGTVVLQVIFASTGDITQIRALNTLPFGLTERAIAAARAIKFMPAMKSGRPVSVYMQLEYNFNLY